MIFIQNKAACCGCNACGDVCAHHAISFKTDNEGFWYPEVDTEKCSNCGLCEKVCPIINIASLKHNDLQQSECHAAINKNIEVRFDSTSGGLFSAFAERVYKLGGYVGGAVFNEDFYVKQFISGNKEDLPALRSSKYLQSDAQGFYKSVRELLKSDNLVLVCGTPCQMAALRAFLRKDYDNLIIVDFICRGINSPKVFRSYLNYLEEKYNSKVVYFKAKNKELGWRKLTSKVVFENGKILYDTRDTSYFTTGYLSTGVYSRPSCYECKFKGFPRIADITVADYWGAEKTVGKELDNDLGTSLVMLNSKKGMMFFDSVKPFIKEELIPFNSILKGNPALTKSLNSPLVNRDQFYNDLNNLPFKEVAEKYIVRSVDRSATYKRRIKNTLRFVKAVLISSGLSLPTFWKNLKYNFLCGSIKTNIALGHFVVIKKHCVLNLHNKSKVVLNGILTLGWKKFSNSSLETRLLLEKNATLIVNGDTSIGYGSDVEVFDNAKLTFGGGVATNINATIICAEEICFGEWVKLGRDVTVRDNNGNHFMSTRGYKSSRPVVIEQHAWLCEGCTVLPGAKIETGAIIGAKSLVAIHVPAHSLVSGNPAQIIDEDIYWKY